MGVEDANVSRKGKSPNLFIHHEGDFSSIVQQHRLVPFLFLVRQVLELQDDQAVLENAHPG